MTLKQMVFLALAGSVAVMLGAIGSQYLGGLLPCKLCIWQRWPHGIAIALGLVWLVYRDRRLPLLAGLVVLAGAGIGVYHAGVEQAWWPGPDTCTAGSIGGLTTDELLDKILNTPVIRCDDIQWSLFGLTMAAWNALISVVLAGLWFTAYASSSASQ
ncbi:MAG: disulfide bond formation protein B [Paracoccaceae bacterium]